MFVHSCGLHGVEGFAGSAIQLQWLDEGVEERPADCAVVLLHVLNPYGMAWLRRCNEHNVDLNRNFLERDDAYEGAPEGFARLDQVLSPSGPPSRELFYPRALWLIARYGLAALRQTIAEGQYVNPKGLFFGGARMEEGPRLLEQYVREYLAGVERLVVVDVHTGLGPFGIDTILVPEADENEPLFTNLRDTFGHRVSSMSPTAGPAYRVRGGHETMYRRWLSRGNIWFVGQEFGTYNVVRVVKALRAENQWHHYGDRRQLDHPAKRALRETFCPDDHRWREAVLRRGGTVIRQAIALVRGDDPGKE